MNLDCAVTSAYFPLVCNSCSLLTKRKLEFLQSLHRFPWNIKFTLKYIFYRGLKSNNSCKYNFFSNSTRAAHPNFFIQLHWKTYLLYELRRLFVNIPSGHSGEVDVQLYIHSTRRWRRVCGQRHDPASLTSEMRPDTTAQEARWAAGSSGWVRENSSARGL